MSARSMTRARQRSDERRGRRIARNAAIGAVALLGAAAVPEVASAAPFTVTNTNDSGAGSLRGALGMANTTPAADTISFAPNVTGTITLSSGRLVSTYSATIVGPGANVLKLLSPSDGVILLNDFTAGSSTLEIEGLTLEGHASGSGNCGGAVTVGGSSGGLTIRNTTISGSTSSNEGGAICSRETSVSLIDSTLVGNVAGTNGGAIDGRGAPVSISGSTLTGNKTTSGNGGAIEITESAGPKQAGLTSDGSTISGNRASGKGGGIDVNSADGATSIQGSTISGNTASGNGGGLYFGYGAALSIDSSTFDHNSTPIDGGGLYVYAPDGPTTISDSTIANNSTIGRGGGVFSFGYYDKPVTFTSSTIANNVAAGGPGSGSGIFQEGFDAIGPNYAGPDEIALQNTIVADNLGGDLGHGASATSPVKAAFSLITAPGTVSVSETVSGSNQINTGLIPLGVPADNGGPTQTILPPASSPVVDAGSAAGLTTDQRGLARTVDQPLVADAAGSDGTDIGAAELADAELSGAKVKVKKKQKQKGKKIVIVAKAGAAEPVTIEGSGTVKLGKKKVKLTEPKVSVAANKTGTLKLKPTSKKGMKKIAKALAKGKKAKASVAVTLTDAAGNSAEGSAKVTLKGKRKK